MDTYANKHPLLDEFINILWLIIDWFIQVN